MTKILFIQTCTAKKLQFKIVGDKKKIFLNKMNVEIVELDENFEKTNFCGFSLYQPQPPRNAKLAPKRFVENAKGFFEEHTQEEKEILMKNYCE